MDNFSRIFKIKDELLLSSEQLSDVLKMNDFKEQKLTDSKTDDFCKYIGIDTSEFDQGLIDLSSIKSDFLKEEFEIPDEYIDAAGTFMDSIRSMSDFVESRLNSASRKLFLDELGLSEHAIRADGILVNARTLFEAEKSLKNLGFNNLDMNDMATFFNISNERRRRFYETFKDCKTDFELARKMCVMANNHYEKNFKYSIRHFGNSFVVTGTSYEEIHDILKLKEITGDLIMNFKAYTFVNASIIVFGRPMELLEAKGFCSNGRHYQQYIFKENQFKQLAQ